MTELDEGRSFTWVARGPGVRCTGTHVVEPHHERRSRATAILVQAGPLGPVVGFLTRGLTRRYLAMEPPASRRARTRTYGSISPARMA